MANDIILFEETLLTVPRWYNGNMCGVRVPGIAPVPGGAADPSLILSWFYDRYNEGDRERIRNSWINRGYTDVLLSWPDSRAFGRTPEGFLNTCEELVDGGFLPSIMWSSKDIDPADVEGIKRNVEPALQLLLENEAIARSCVGWELSLWLSPTQVQELIDWFAPIVVPRGIQHYVHFQEGYFAFQQPDHPTCDFWNANVEKLNGIFHQKDLNWDAAEYQARITDCLQRFAGQDGFVSDSGFGHPFDFIAMEISAMQQFNGGLDEAGGNALGQVAINTPLEWTHDGQPVMVNGTGNGS